MMTWMAEIENPDWLELSPEQRMERLQERIQHLEARVAALEGDKKICDGSDRA